MSRLAVALIEGVSTGPRDGAGFESRGPGAENQTVQDQAAAPWHFQPQVYMLSRQTCIK